MKNGLPPGALGDQPLECFEFRPFTEQRREHRRGVFAAQGVEPELQVVASARPFMAVLRTIVHEQQHARTGDAVGEQVEQRLGLGVDPMQVLEDHHQRVLERLAQDDPLDRFERAPAPDLRVHLGQRIGAFLYSEQSQQVRQRIAERRVECGKRGTDFLAPRGRIVRVLNTENSRAAIRAPAARPRPCRATPSKPPAPYSRAAVSP